MGGCRSRKGLLNTAITNVSIQTNNNKPTNKQTNTNKKQQQQEKE